MTNDAFKAFLDATHYHPQDDLNFVGDWKRRNVSPGMGEQACHLGFSRRRALFCGVGRKATAA